MSARIVQMPVAMLNVARKKPIAIIDNWIRFIVGYCGEKVIVLAEDQDLPGVVVLEAHEVTREKVT